MPERPQNKLSETDQKVIEMVTENAFWQAMRDTYVKRKVYVKVPKVIDPSKSPVIEENLIDEYGQSVPGLGGTYGSRNAFMDSRKNAIAINNNETIYDEERLLPDPNISILQGFFDFNHSSYAGVSGFFLKIKDIALAIFVVPLNIVGIFTEVLPLTGVKALEKHTEINDVLSDIEKGKIGVLAKPKNLGTFLLYSLLSSVRFIGGTISSPAKNVRECFADWSNKKWWQKALAFPKALISIACTTLAYLILIPALLTVLSLAVGVSLIAATASAITSIPVVGPVIAHAANTLGGAILKGLNSIPGVKNIVTWLMPSKPSFIPGQTNPVNYMHQVQTTMNTAENVKTIVGSSAMVGAALSTVPNAPKLVEAVRRGIKSQEKWAKDVNTVSNLVDGAIEHGSSENGSSFFHQTQKTSADDNKSTVKNFLRKFGITKSNY